MKNKTSKAISATMAAAMLTVAFSASAFASTNTTKQEDVVMMLGQSKAYVGSSQVSANVAPVLLNNSTYVPLRFVSESFGADVSYDADKKEVAIKADGHTYKVKLNDSKATSDKGTIDLGAKVQMKNGSVLVPMRAIAENILDKHVAYKDGLIYISKEEKQLDASSAKQWKNKWGQGASAKSESVSAVDRDNTASLPAQSQKTRRQNG